MSTSTDSMRHFESYYTGEEQTWQRLGAIDKARNIANAWSVAVNPRFSRSQFTCHEKLLAVKGEKNHVTMPA